MLPWQQPWQHTRQRGHSHGHADTWHYMHKNWESLKRNDCRTDAHRFSAVKACNRESASTEDSPCLSCIPTHPKFHANGMGFGGDNRGLTQNSRTSSRRSSYGGWTRATITGTELSSSCSSRNLACRPGCACLPFPATTAQTTPQKIKIAGPPSSHQLLSQPVLHLHCPGCPQSARLVTVETLTGSCAAP